MSERDHIDTVMDDIRVIFSDIKTDMLRGFDGVNMRLDKLNDRTRTNEVDIGILKDRSNKAFTIAGLAGTIGAIMLELGVYLSEKFIFR